MAGSGGVMAVHRVRRLVILKQHRKSRFYCRCRVAVEPKLRVIDAQAFSHVNVNINAWRYNANRLQTGAAIRLLIIGLGTRSVYIVRGSARTLSPSLTPRLRLCLQAVDAAEKCVHSVATWLGFRSECFLPSRTSATTFPSSTASDEPD